MITRPLPFDIPYSFVCDAKGNGSFQQVFGRDYWYKPVVTGSGGTQQTSWTIQKNKLFLTPGLGSQVTLACGLFSPGSFLDISVSGATPNATISGLILGDKATDPSSFEGGNSPTFSVLSAQNVQAPTVLLGTVTTPDGNINTQQTNNFPLPIGTVAVTVTLNTTNSISVRVTGHDTGNNYIIAPFLNKIMGEMISQKMDSSVDVRVTNLATGTPGSVEVIAWLTPAVLIVRAPIGEELNVVLSNSPPPWQQPNLEPINIDTTLAGGANLSLAAPPATQHVYIFSVIIAVDAAPGTGGFELQDSTGTAIHTFISTGAGAQPPQFFYGYGNSLPAGIGLRLHNNFAGSLTVFGSAVLSQI